MSARETCESTFAKSRRNVIYIHIRMYMNKSIGTQPVIIPNGRAYGIPYVAPYLKIRLYIDTKKLIIHAPRNPTMEFRTKASICS